jgi:dephospho-CoA kinase
MLTVGLTGGIASGKTTVSDLFSSLGTPIIDTDIISRKLLETDQPGYQFVIKHFGSEILLGDGQIDRAKLRRLIFNNETEKLWLESRLHPMIYQQTEQLIEQNLNAAYVLIVIPLLFESNFRSLVSRVLVIDCSPHTQTTRLIARDNIDRELAIQMLAQQWDNQARLEQADDVICNDGDNNLSQQVAKLHQQYLSLSA